MDIIVPIIIIFIILLQFYFFRKNSIRMKEFHEIFHHEESFTINKDSSGFVSGIQGEGNVIFANIQASINKYLANNKGSVIDFHLLKDAVDRHYDSVEDDVNSQTPVPLYCGLAGTMAGVIFGLCSLLKAGSLTALMGTATTQIAHTATDAAAVGINDLLSGVAWAMVASVFGIILTTINSLRFKNCKLEAEKGKNIFLAWMQSELLPELPTDTSEALSKLVLNLNRFNSDFSQNTKELKVTLDKVNQSYSTQAEIIVAVKEMDVMKMAKANIKVLEELQQSTDKLEQFNKYLNHIKGYTATIQEFNKQFASEAERLHVLEEIRDFFKSEMTQINQRKAEIAKTVGDVDLYLKEALADLGRHANVNMAEISKSLLVQGDVFKDFLREEKDMFAKLSSEVHQKFAEQMKQTPQIAGKMEEISKIPEQLDKLVQEISVSNAKLANRIEQAITRRDDRSAVSDNNQIPQWMTWTLTISTVCIAVYAVVQLGQVMYKWIS